MSDYPRPRAKTHFEVVRTIAACCQVAMTIAILFHVYGVA
jgi:hypothetical protein